MSCPPTITFPVSGVVKPPNIRRVVVLPQPLGPSKVTKLFSLMERFRSSRTSSPSKLFDMCCKSMKGWLMIIKISFYLNVIKNLAASSPTEEGPRSCLSGNVSYPA